MTVEERMKAVRLILLDVDGVLTPGTIVLDHQGEEVKAFHVHDGYGLVLARRAGLKTGILSARYCAAVEHRARDLGVDRVCQNAYPKLTVYEQLCKELGVSDEQVCFMGDDLPDCAVMKRVGLAVSVPNAHDLVREQAHWVTQRRGGEGAVRELIEKILKAQGLWEGIVHDITG